MEYWTQYKKETDLGIDFERPDNGQFKNPIQKFVYHKCVDNNKQ